MRHTNEHGIALITTLLVMMLISSVLVGFTAIVISDQRYRFIDRDRGQAFYAASGALEKLTADLGNLFYTEVAPSGAQVADLTSTTNKAVIAGTTFTGAAPTPLAASELSPLYCKNTINPVINRQTRTVGSSGYTITFCADTATSEPITTGGYSLIQSGPYAALIALKTPYQLDVTARTATGGEVHLVRTIESVAIPVFQFGIFSEVDLAFNAGDDFSFGGRVHTNGNLFLAEGGNSDLTINAKITAVGDVVRQRLSNGVSIDDSGHTGTVSIAKDSSSYVTMLRTWGSVIAGAGSAVNPLWQGVSLTTYKGYIRNGDTGARPLSLPLITVGGTTPDITRRPSAGDDAFGPLFNQRLFSKASLRILLSDTAADITGLPTVTGTAPIFLDGNWSVTKPVPGYATVTSANPPVALSPGPLTMTAGSPASGGTGIINVTAATAAAFKPRFTLSTFPNNIISCTAKLAPASPLLSTLTGCTPAMPVGLLGTITVVSPANGSVGATAPMVATTASTITFATGFLATGFPPLPFWETATRKLITCTGYGVTTYTGCSSVPANNAILTSNATTNAAVGLLGGYIKIERQAPDGTWSDVTLEILNYGIGDNNQEGFDCQDPTPKAIIRLQRLRDNASSVACDYDTDATGAKDPTNWWPNVLYDAREAVQRDSGYPGVNMLTFNGVIHYVTLDAGNLSKWFRGTTPYNTGTGTNSMTDTGGFTVYFSDRRNNRNESSQETGEYGFEDIVNPVAANGAPNGTLDAGENVNGSVISGTTTPTQQLYGGHPSANGVYNTVPPGSPFSNITTPTSTLTDPQARVNRAIFFRRALKLKNGRDIRATGVTGLTIVAENPVYVQGDWNVDATGTNRFAGAHAATAVIADGVTILTGNWNDVDSLEFPYTASNRPRAAEPWYRMAVLAGKSLIFPNPTGTGSTFGTDGGAHSFLRYLEGDPTSGTDKIHYRGSMATFYYSRQATGIFKGGGAVVYMIPAFRDFAFDPEFMTPSLLPPNTPVFRDMNTVGFSQELRPGR